MSAIPDHLGQMDIASFFRWWCAALAQAVPVRLKRALGLTRSDVVVTVDESSVVTARWINDQTERELGRYPVTDAGRLQWRLTLNQEPELRDARVVLRLTARQALSRQIIQPRAVGENLQRVMAFEMDRHTPFSAGQVYYAARVLERLPGGQQIRVLLAVTPRARLDVLLRDLAVVGINPMVVEVDDAATAPGATAYNLLPEALRSRGGRRWGKRSAAALGALLGVLLVACCVFPAWQYHAARRNLAEQVELQSRVAKKVQALQEQAESLTKHMQFLTEKRSKQVYAVDLVNSLSEVLPDDTWLTNLSYKDGKVELQGFSPAASQLIELIERTPLFKNAAFVSPITQDRVQNLERFQIGADVVITTPAAIDHAAALAPAFSGPRKAFK